MCITLTHRETSRIRDTNLQHFSRENQIKLLETRYIIKV